MSTGRETRRLPVEMRRCLPEEDSLFTGGRQDVYRKETEGVYRREKGCLQDGDRVSTRRQQKVNQ